jgi:dihydrofolate synthase / folylpolyglutamate synthase
MPPSCTLNYAEFTTRLFEQNQFAIKYDLEAMREAVALLGLPTLARTVVLIGGTNGKGSVACLLHAACLAAGLRTGLYTSPHLVDFRERIRLDGTPISQADCARLGGELFRRFSGRDAPAEGLRALSFFELTTLLAFAKFARSDLDVLILEVGMGGRLDATNVVEPDISVLTSVSLDHQQYLGDTVAQIAREKAAIARSGKPCVLHRSSGGFEELHTSVADFRPQVHVVDGGENAPEWNRALAARTFELIAARHGISGAACASLVLLGFRRARWPARRQVAMNGATKWFIDGAHNEASIADIAPWFRDVASRVGHLPAVVGVSPGRDIGAVFRPLADCFAEVHVVPASSQRSVDPMDVVAGLEQAGWKGPFLCHPSASDAVRALHGHPHIACVGSLYLAGSVLQALGHTPESLNVYSQDE